MYQVRFNVFQLTILRINDFVALVVTGTKDYKNSGMDSAVPSTLTVETPLYVGGAPSNIVGPFNSISDIPVSFARVTTHLKIGIREDSMIRYYH